MMCISAETTNVMNIISMNEAFGGFLHGEHEQPETGNNLARFKEAHEQYDEHDPDKQVILLRLKFIT